jgi:hypothetical protein
MTEREKELEATVARLRKTLESVKPYLCMNAKCDERKKGSYCPHCGDLIP